MSDRNELLLNKKKKSGMATKRRNELIFLACLFALPILHKCTFYFGTAIRAVLLSFQEYNPANGQYELSGFVHFQRIFKDLAESPVLRTSLKNTVKLYFVDTFISIPISLFCSFFVVKKVPGHGFLKIVFFLPSIVSSVVMVLMFKYFGEYAVPGMLSKYFDITKYPYIFSEEGYAFTMMIVYQLWVGFASGIVLYLGAMTRVPDGVTDAAMIDGVSVLGEFWHITMPTVYPTLSVFLVTGFVSIFTGGGPIYTFYEDNAPSHTYTMGYYLFTQVIGDNSSAASYPYAAALGLLITIIAAPLTFLLKYALEKYGPTEA